jgi:hypothetical protein
MDRSIKSFRTQLADQSGAALVVALIMLLGLAAMGMAAVMISSSDYVVAGTQRQRTQALHVAEAGLHEAMHRLAEPTGTIANVGGNAVDIAINDPADPPDPNWNARIFNRAPGATPVVAGSAVTTGTIQVPGDYLQYSDPNDPAEALLIRHKLRDFNGDGVPEVALYDPSRIPQENPSTGWPIERVTVRGRTGQALRVIQADLVRFPLNPNVSAALMADGSIDLRGTVTVCGHNHRIDTPPGTELPVCSPAWDEAMGNLVGAMTTGTPVLTAGSTDLLGSPSPTNTDPTNQFQSLAQTLGLSDQELAEVLANADRTALNGGGPWDGISYIDGDLAINGGTGSGLLYVNGDMSVAGNFQWTGLVYMEGQLKNNGTTWVLGGVMCRGGGAVEAVDFGAGNPTVLYSRAALVQTLTLAMDYIVLSWKEL